MSGLAATKICGHFILLGLLLLTTEGCLTTHLVENKAQAHVEYSAQEQQLREVPAQPGYYALLPLTVAADIITSPFQLGYFVATGQSHMGTATIHGVPVPLP